MKKILVGIFSIGMAGLLWAGSTFTGKVIDRPVAAVDETIDVDVSRFDRISVQAVYEDASPSASTISDGAKELGNITVSNYASLVATKASVYINVKSTTGLSGDSITLNGIVFTQGIDWSVGTTTSTTAENIKAKIDAHPDFACTRSVSTLTITASDFGTAANSWAVSTTDSNLSTSAVLFSGGKVQPIININGTLLKEDDDWDAETSNTVTAGNIADAINANSTLSSVMVATKSAAVVYATSTYAGDYDWYMSVNVSSITVSIFSGGKASDVDVSADTLYEASHGFTTGLALLYDVVSGTTLTGLTDNTTYYAIRYTDDKYQVATSTTNALAGTDIDITNVIGSGSFTFTPIAFSAGTCGFHWQASNDGASFTDVPSISSVTYSADGNAIWDLGEYDYKYLRLNYKQPTWGGLDLDVYLHGKE